jgi:acyl dehydratase
MRLDGFARAVNYGLNKVRFPAPLPVGDRVRMTARLDGLEELPGGAPAGYAADVRARGRGQAGVRGRVAGEGLRRVSCREVPLTRTHFPAQAA